MEILNPILNPLKEEEFFEDKISNSLKEIFIQK
jgi:hypothetical protein